MKIDSINWKILEILQRDSRSSLKEIAEKVGLSSPSISERIQKMEDMGVIESYQTKLNIDSLGYTLGVYISMKLWFGLTKQFEKNIINFPEVFECYKLTGSHCIIIKAYVKDTENLENLNVRLSVYGVPNISLILNSLLDKKVITEGNSSK